MFTFTCRKCSQVKSQSFQPHDSLCTQCHIVTAPWHYTQLPDSLIEATHSVVSKSCASCGAIKETTWRGYRTQLHYYIAHEEYAQIGPAKAWLKAHKAERAASLDKSASLQGSQAGIGETPSG
ncbi:MAG: hypothetical protein GY774_17760, partial [Planctomycetes bacterium]|nr:hypothetical protein [Planctomycetota bacterium]